MAPSQAMHYIYYIIIMWNVLSWPEIEKFVNIAMQIIKSKTNCMFYEYIETIISETNIPLYHPRVSYTYIYIYIDPMLW